MSIPIETPFGALRKTQHRKIDGRSINWQWECPICKVWGGIDDEQLAGRISINCAASGHGCTYHETHDFRPYIADSQP